MSDRVYNFSPGPAMLPTEVLEQVQAELLNWHDSGMSVMEVSHRGVEFAEIIQQSEKDLRELLNIPRNYHVLFLTGGATSQFAMVPLNLLVNNIRADYIDTGIWSKKAIMEAKRYGDIHVAASLKNEKPFSIPLQNSWDLRKNAAYVHYTPNETISGVEFSWIPETNRIPLVADMSSTLLSRPIDVSKFGLIYASAQKNVGMVGVTLVIIREDLIKEPIAMTPSLYSYQQHVEARSLSNTAPTFSWYVTGLVLQWLKKQGGLSVFAERNQRKAEKLYDFIDHSDFYENAVDPQNRSWMNVTFDLKNTQLTSLFLTGATQKGLFNLRGHKIQGGIRASIYNAMPEAGVDALISFMAEFQNRGRL